MKKNKTTKNIIVIALILIIIIFFYLALSLLVSSQKANAMPKANATTMPNANAMPISNESHVNPCKDKLTDEEFLKHMIPHHEVAVYMSQQLLNKTQNPIILKILRNIIRIQLYEIAMMKDSMAVNKNKYIHDDMSNLKLEMNSTYYNTLGDFVKPNKPEITDTFCDPSFFSVTHELHEMTDEAYMKHMIPHHQVAVDMSKRILKTSKNDFIIYMAYRIIRSQQPEIAELTNLLNSPYMYKSSLLPK